MALTRAASLIVLGSAAALIAAAACRSTVPSADAAGAPRFEVGRPAAPEEIAQWDRDVNGSGEGLPPGRGTAERGAVLYAASCAMCHGAGGAGSQLIRPRDPSVRERRNIASHWPYAPPLFDYIWRTMPPAAPRSLPPDDVYALLAFLLAENGIVGPGTAMDAAGLKGVTMPARERFVIGDGAPARR